MKIFLYLPADEKMIAPGIFREKNNLASISSQENMVDTATI
jgi:hypothetical protein